MSAKILERKHGQQYTVVWLRYLVGLCGVSIMISMKLVDSKVTVTNEWLLVLKMVWDGC